MTGKKYQKSEFSFLLDSFLPDRRFLFIALLEIILIVLLLSGYYVFSLKLAQFAPEALKVKQSLGNNIYAADLTTLENVQSSITTIYRVVLTYSLLLGVFTLFCITFCKSLIYCTVNRVRLSRKLFWKFLLTTILWGIIFALLFLLVQFILARIFVDSFMTNMASQFLVMSVSALTLLILFYLTVCLLSSLVINSSIKKAFAELFKISLKKFRRFLLPLFFELIIFIALNLILFVLVLFSKRVFVILTAILLLYYFVWVRLYNVSVFTRLRQLPQKPGLQAVKMQKHKNTRIKKGAGVKTAKK
jgi:hypothetical protein